MSIEEHFANEAKSKKPRHFHEVAGKLLNEREQEDTRPFKWEEEITEKDWKQAEEEIISEFENNREGFISYKNLWLLYEMFILNPDYQPTFPNELIESIVGYVEDNRRHNHWNNVVMGQFVLQHLQMKKIDITDIEKTKMEKFPTDSLAGEIEYRISLLLRAPHLFAIITEAQREKIDNYIEEMRSAGNTYFAQGLLLYKLLGIPYKNLSIAEWNNLISLSVGFKKNMQFKFGSVAQLRILAAHKVECTDQGLVITDLPPTKLDTTLPPRPIRKKK